MVFYIMLAVYALLSLLSVKVNTERGNKFFIFFLMLPMFVFAAFRDVSIGPDTYNYYRIYNSIALQADLSFINIIRTTRLEPGYIAVNIILARLGCSYYVMQVLFTAFIYFEIGKFIERYSRQPAFSCFIFFATRAMFGTMNVVRMWVAVAILLSTLPSIRQRNLARFLLLVFLAGLFHYSALLFLAVYPVYRFKLTTRRIVLLFAICLVIWQTAVPVFTFITRTIGLYGNYITTNRFSGSVGLATLLGLIVNLSFFALFFSVREKNNPQSKMKQTDDSYWDFYFLMIVLTVAISIVGLSNNIMGRIVHYFSIFLVVSIPEAIKRIRNIRSRITTRFVTVLGLAASYSVIMELRPEWYMVLPYKFFS